MRIKQALSILGLAFFGLTAVAQVASADPAAKKGSDGSIYFTGLGSRESLSFELKAFAKQKSYKANECGFITITADPGGNGAIGPYVIDGTQGPAWADIPIITESLKCSKGAVTNVGLPSGSVFRYGGGADWKVYKTGLSPFSSVDVVDKANSQVKKSSASYCGTSVLKFNAPYVGTVAVSGDAGTSLSVDTSTLAVAVAAPICSNGVTYLPVGY
jgi:hypothetical protein